MKLFKLYLCKENGLSERTMLAESLESAKEHFWRELKLRDEYVDLLFVSIKEMKREASK